MANKEQRKENAARLSLLVQNMINKGMTSVTPVRIVNHVHKAVN